MVYIKKIIIIYTYKTIPFILKKLTDLLLNLLIIKKIRIRP
jgi:hypothetical protein